MMIMPSLLWVASMFLAYVAFALHMLAIGQFVYAVYRWDHRFHSDDKFFCRMKNIANDRVERSYIAMGLSSITSFGFILILIPHYFEYSAFLSSGSQLFVAIVHCMTGLAVNVWCASAIMGFKKRDLVGGWDEGRNRYESA